jgi:hypothetical protein
VTIRSATKGALAACLVAWLATAGMPSDAGAQAPQEAVATQDATPPAARMRKVSPYHPVSVTPSARNHYVVVSGVDTLRVRRTGSDLIRFSYRVIDTERARPLSDKTATPYLIGHRSRAVLQVPVMDKVGALRQAQTPQPGQEYWMVFSNKGDVVKAGERVSVVIGTFRADGLLVE